jgi:hypothetical protein
MTEHGSEIWQDNHSKRGFHRILREPQAGVHEYIIAWVTAITIYLPQVQTKRFSGKRKTSKYGSLILVLPH